MKLANLLFLVTLCTEPAFAGLIVTFDSGRPDESFPVTISGTYNDGTPIVFNPNLICTIAFGAPTQCVLSAVLPPNSFPTFHYAGGVDLLEPSGEPNRGSAGDTSDVYQVHARSGNCIANGVAGSCYVGVIIGITDVETSLPQTPGAGKLLESGAFQDITNAFQGINPLDLTPILVQLGIVFQPPDPFDPTLFGKPNPLPLMLAPPNATHPNDLVPLTMIVRSDVVPEPGTVALVWAGLIPVLGVFRSNLKKGKIWHYQIKALNPPLYPD